MGPHMRPGSSRIDSSLHVFIDPSMKFSEIAALLGGGVRKSLALQQN